MLVYKPVKFGFEGFHHLEIVSGNAFQAAYFYANYLGFEPIFYKNAYTGNNELCSFILRNGDIVLQVSSPTGSGSSEFREFIGKHGDTVKTIGFKVTGLDELVSHLKTNGAAPSRTVNRYDSSANPKVKSSAIDFVTDVGHEFIENLSEDPLAHFRNQNYKPIDNDYELNAINKLIGQPLFSRIDHIGMPQFQNQMSAVTEKYYRLLGFHHFWSVDENVIFSKYSTLKSTVVSDFSERVKFPIFEPKMLKKKSQIQEFLDYNGGPGVQHVAIVVDDIIQVVDNLRKRGVKFLKNPSSYYDIIEQKLKEHGLVLKEDLSRIRANDILIDYDERGYLLQIFTAPILDRPTLFFEFIQRNNNEGFGEGNFQRLFEAIEAEQNKLGNLV